MDTSEQVLRQLKWIKWLMALIAFCFIVIAGSTVFLAWNFDSIVAEDDALFMAKAQSLLDAGKEGETLKLVEERERDHPKDVYVHWYRGVAHYRLDHFDDALKSLRVARELEPSWRERFTDPFIKSVEEELAQVR